MGVITLSKTFLNGVNDVLTRASIITSSGTLSSFTDSGKQVFVDIAKQIWNETVDHVCYMMGIRVGESGSGTITLVTDTREYSLPADLVQIRWPLVDQTNGNYIREYPGGYEAMRSQQPIPANNTGLPYWAAINPTTGMLRMDRSPTSSENGNAYDLLYDTDLVMSLITDTFPFSDATYRALVPVVTTGFENKKRNDFDPVEYRRELARALAYSNKNERRTHW